MADNREAKTADELAQMIERELNDPTVQVTIFQDEHEDSSWTAQEVIRGPVGDQAIRVRQIAQRLRKLYRVKS